MLPEYAVIFINSAETSFDFKFSSWISIKGIDFA